MMYGGEATQTGKCEISRATREELLAKREEPIAKRVVCGEIKTEIETGEKIIEVLHSAIERLQERVEPVLRREPQCGSDAEKACERASPVAEILRQHNSRIQYAISKINAIIERCEL